MATNSSAGHHSSQRAYDGQRGLANVRQFAVHDLVLDLHAHQEKENRHQRVVDPGVYRKLNASTA